MWRPTLWPGQSTNTGNNLLVIDTGSSNPDTPIVSAVGQHDAYTLPAGSYSYTGSFCNDSNDWVTVTLVNASNNNVIATIVPGNRAPWQGLVGGLSGSFSLNESTNVSIRYNNNYYQYGSRVLLSFSRSVPTEAYAAVLADSFSSASDARLKNQIVNLDGALDKIDNIRGVYHHWIHENQPQERQIGVIAQEVQAVYPELVNEGGNGLLSVNYPKLTAVLLQSIKELKAMVLELAKKQ